MHSSLFQILIAGIVSRNWNPNNHSIRILHPNCDSHLIPIRTLPIHRHSWCQLNWRIFQRLHPHRAVDNPVPSSFSIPQPMTQELQTTFWQTPTKKIHNRDSGHVNALNCHWWHAKNLESDGLCMHWHFQEELLVPRRNTTIFFRHASGEAAKGFHLNEFV